MEFNCIYQAIYLAVSTTDGETNYWMWMLVVGFRGGNGHILFLRSLKSCNTVEVTIS
ncbi:hypothetical protein C5167_050140 [Papaver somniferum]|uniref:Uncharacterized protein n=1 Tax=Papaver somniferum TaxID=3469 RepID=A0A4Y7KQJ4_PAPSO|nr:hypothetical protein C5167_050140 [Papaver somniferum]